MSVTPVCIVWFRRDLRLHDHAALAHAQALGAKIVPLYIHAPDDEGAWIRGAASCAWLDRSLRALEQSLRALGAELIVRQADRALTALSEVINECQATHVLWHRLYDPALVERDQHIKTELRARGIEVKSFAGHLIHEPDSIRTGGGDVYRVFTPYWRNALARMRVEAPLPAVTEIRRTTLRGVPIDALKLRDARGWDKGFWAHYTPGEQGAQQALEVFAEGALAHYTTGRDRPDQIGTSRLSPHLHFGEISVNQVIHQLQALALNSNDRAHADFYIRELGWRDFSHQLLFYFAHTTDAPLNTKFAAFPWAEVDPIKLRAWQRGNTGVPIVDAGMRELWQTGWMHNRVRMIVASYLTKNLRYHWLHGARWFWDKLLDADLANNTQGWQWSAGCGADAAPYFRIFNPVTQGERFDPTGAYVKHYIPELSKLAPKHVHQPWTVGGVPGYPAPIVDLAQSRADALAAFSELKVLSA
jgi:deoxyribodipyrimidine photo-lyase